MERRKFTREFKLEAVRLIKDRGVSYVQASQDLGVHTSQLRDWVKKLADDPQHAFPGHGQMKPEQLEIARLKREVTKLKAERDILKKPRPTSRRNRREVRFHCEAPGDLAGSLDVRGARCLAGWVLCLADTTAQSAQPKQRRARCEGACHFLASDRTYGARRVWRDLLTEGISCGLHRIERLMRLQALKARPRRRRLPPDLGERQERARTHLRSICSQPQMDCRLHVCVDGGGLALRGCGH